MRLRIPLAGALFAISLSLSTPGAQAQGPIASENLLQVALAQVGVAPAEYTHAGFYNVSQGTSWSAAVTAADLSPLGPKAPAAGHVYVVIAVENTDSADDLTIRWRGADGQAITAGLVVPPGSMRAWNVGNLGVTQFVIAGEAAATTGQVLALTRKP